MKKRLLGWGLVAAVSLLLSAATPVRAQEREAESKAEAEHSRLEPWKWANFLILAGLIGYMIGKNAPGFFASRSQQIRKDMLEAEQARAESEAKMADVEKRFASLEADIAALRAESQREQTAGEASVRSATSAEIAKIQHNAKQEIEAAGKAARQELKRYTAGLAIELAQQKIQARMTPETQADLVKGFVQDAGASPAQDRKH
jgi:F-type H+-transporting ATPase subunit b